MKTNRPEKHSYFSARLTARNRFIATLVFGGIAMSAHAAPQAETAAGVSANAPAAVGKADKQVEVEKCDDAIV